MEDYLEDFITLYPLITPEIAFDAVILCNGDYPAPNSVAHSILQNTKYVCCCDGAAATYIEREGRLPQAIVGDGDSLPQSLQEKYKDIFIRIPEQEENDQTKATRHCLSKGLYRIAYLGCTGKREDHTIGNISLIMHYAKDLDADPVMITDYGSFMPAFGSADFDTFPGQKVSIFNFECHQMRSEGLKWKIYPFDQLWQGTLNEALGDSISIRADGTYMVYRTFDK